MKSFLCVSYMYFNLFKDRFWLRDLSLSTARREDYHWRAEFLKAL